MTRKKPELKLKLKLKQASTTLGYVIWSYPDHSIVDDVAFDTRDEAEDYVKDGLRQEDFVAQDVVICELVPRCRPEAPVTKVQFKEVG
jgi:hypothetical protein